MLESFRITVQDSGSNSSTVHNDDNDDDNSTLSSDETLHSQKFMTIIDNQYFIFGDEKTFRHGLKNKVRKLTRSMEEEAVTNDNGKWKDAYKYVVYQPAFEAILDPSQPHRIRDKGNTGKRLDDFVNHLLAKDAELTQAEVAALRMYTGPFYIPWNYALRFSDKDPTLLESWQTCISVLYSAVLKLSHESNKCIVYRGVNESKMKIHESFYNATGDYFAGGTELAFMSTTTDEAVALEYAQRGSTTDCTIFKIPPDMASRGASVNWISQYSYENGTIAN